MYINNSHFEAIEAAIKLLPHDDPATIDIVKNAEAALADMIYRQKKANKKVAEYIQEKRKIDPTYSQAKRKRGKNHE